MDIQKINFDTKRYLVVKKTISTDEIDDKQMYELAYQKLYSYLEKNSIKAAGPAVVIYFKWDELSKVSEIGIAVPVNEIDSVNDPELLLADIPKSKAIMTTLEGGYSGLGDAHMTLMNHLMENKMNYSNIAIEEYAEMSDSNSEDNITNVYYLYN